MALTVWKAMGESIDPEALHACVDRLRQGQILAIPTETVYGLAVDARNGAALASLRELKGRAAEKVFPVQVASLADLEQLSGGTIPPLARRLLDRFSPGPLTVIIPIRETLPASVQGPAGAVGIRIPDHPITRAILQAFGAPLAVTSANLSGHPPATAIEQVLEQVGGGIAAAIDAGPCRLGAASTVVDFTASPWRILREGAIPTSQIQKTLGPADG